MPIAEDKVKFLSNLFIVPKKDNTFRPIINLRQLNKYVKYVHFKMDSIHSLIDLLSRGSYMAKLDLKDAYFSVPVSVTSGPFLCFKWQSTIYSFNCLPFGLSSSPRVFTKILRPIAGFLRSQGIKIIVYLDDILIISDDFDSCLKDVKTVTFVLQSLGFTINENKSVTLPTKRINFLGFLVDSDLMFLSLPDHKLHDLINLCESCLAMSTISLRLLARILGKFNATSLAVFPATLHCRTLQFWFNSYLNIKPVSWDTHIEWTDEARFEVEDWIKSISMWNGRPLTIPEPTVFIQSDACLEGWGATLNGMNASGFWLPSEQGEHINFIELKAAFLALKTFKAHLHNQHIRLLLDNSSAVAYINRQGGTHSYKLCELTLEIWQWSFDNNIQVSAEHIPGVANEADYFSRLRPD